MSDRPKYECMATYHSICINQNGTLDPCCQYLPQKVEPKITTYDFTEYESYCNNTRRRMHDDATNGIRHSGCSKCWQEEDAGGLTLRNRLNNRYIGRSILAIDPNNPTDANNPIYHVELRLGNYCNLKCVTCFPKSSSTVYAERVKYKEEFNKIGIYDSYPMPPKFWETEEFNEFSTKLLSDVMHINITGGEPFIIPEVVNFLDKMIHKKDSVILSFNTNLTVVPDKLRERLMEFTDIFIYASIEGIGGLNDYLRFPSKWDDIQKNINMIKTDIPQAKLNINHTFQHASVYSLPELIEYAHSQSMHVNLTSVQGYPRLTLDSVTPKHIEKFQEWAYNSTLLDNTQQEFILNMIKSSKFDPELHKQYNEYMDLLDRIRGTNYQKTFGPYMS